MGVTALYAALGVAALVLRGFDPTRHYLARDYTLDWMCHYWNVWRHGQVLAGDQPWLHTPSLFHPAGLETLTQFPDLGTMLIAGALVRMVGVDAAMLGLATLVVLGNGLGGYLLGWTVTRDRLAATVTGLLLAFCGYTAWAVNSGNFEYGTWLPMLAFLATLTRMQREPGWRWTLIAGGLLAAAAYVNLAMLAPLLGLAAVLVVARVAAAPPGGPGLRPLAVHTAAVLVVAALLVAPLGVLFAVHSRDRDVQMPHADAVEYGLLRTAANADGVGSWGARAAATPDTTTPFNPGPDHQVRVAWTLVLLLLGTLLVCPQRAARWLFAGWVFLLMSIGPVLRVGLPGTEAVLCLPAPFALAEWLLPFGTRFQYPDRLMALAHIPLAVAAGLLVARLARIERRGLRIGALAAVLILPAVELLATWPVERVDRIPDDPFYAFLAEEERDAAIIEAPFNFNSLDASYMLAQTRHGRPMFNGVNPPYFHADPTDGLLEANPLLLAVVLRQHTVVGEAGYGDRGSMPVITAPPPADADLRDAAAALAKQGFDYLLVHRELPVPVEGVGQHHFDTADLESFLVTWLGEPIAESRALAVYRLKHRKAH